MWWVVILVALLCTTVRRSFTFILDRWRCCCSGQVQREQMSWECVVLKREECWRGKADVNDG